MTDNNDNQIPNSKPLDMGNHGNAGGQPGLADFDAEKLSLSQDFLSQQH